MGVVMVVIELFVVVMEEEDMFVAFVKNIVEMLNIVVVVEMIVVDIVVVQIVGDDIVVYIVEIVVENGKVAGFHN
jgi:hypothetical protein